MSRKVKLTTIAILLCILGVFSIMPLSCCLLGPPPLGTGSLKYARLWKEKLAACNSINDVRTQFNCGRYERCLDGSSIYVRDPNTYKEGNTWALLYEFSNGDWLAMAYANSHNTWGGGTVVTRDNKGTVRVFFGHVCGRPFADGESVEAIYDHFDDSHWKEIHLAR